MKVHGSGGKPPQGSASLRKCKNHDYKPLPVFDYDCDFYVYEDLEAGASIWKVWKAPLFPGSGVVLRVA